MEHFVIITKGEHTGICILQPYIDIRVSSRTGGIVSVEISDSDEMGASVFCLLDCENFQGRYIEDYDEDSQKKILDCIESAIARDIALFAQSGYTYIGTGKVEGEDPDECFFLEEHKAKWQKDYLCILDVFQRETSKNTTGKKQKE